MSVQTERAGGLPPSTRALQLRLDHGYGALEAAEKAKVSPDTLRSLEGGGRAHARTLHKVAQLYGVPASTLLGPPVYDEPESAAA